MRRVFVFGTLKQGFPLHDEGLKGTLCLGGYRTATPYPLVVAGRWYAPMMFDEPGEGFRVKGEVYEVGDERLKLLDALESTPKPGNDRITTGLDPRSFRLRQVERPGDACPHGLPGGLPRPKVHP